MKMTKTFRCEFNFFAPGSLVTPTSPRCPLESGKVYTVTRCFEPLCYGDECVCFVEGHKYGISTEYLEELEASRLERNRKWLANLNAALGRE